jgi:putative ABC transport system substrate-binding protein
MGARPLAHIKRRAFIKLLGGAAAVLRPPAARGQPFKKTHRVGVLANEKWPPLDGLRDGLRDLSYVEGQNLEYVHRYAEGQPERYAAFGALNIDFVHISHQRSA